MKERPILFTGEMVRAILDGRKTQTRRVCHEDVVGPAGEPWHAIVRKTTKYKGSERRSGMECLRCPYGVPGDRLWVRETWALMGPDHSVYTGPMSGLDESESLRCYPIYRESPGFVADRKWRPSIFMPRALSRITLEVTEVRVERVQDISEDDARAEGVTTGKTVPALINGEPGSATFFDPRYAFASLWDGINAKRGFGMATNPWVWVVSFKRLR